MQIEDLFHDSEDVHDRVQENWHFVMDTFPVPDFDLRCPVCHTEAEHHIGPTPPVPKGNIQLSNISYGVRNDSAHPYRADVSFKCTRCSYFWTHGVVIPADVYRNATGTQDKKTWRWREVKQAIKGRPE